MKRLWLLVILQFGVLIAFAQDLPVRNLTLSQSIALALKNNIDIQRGALLTANAKIGLQRSRADLLPDFNGGVIHGINLGRSIDPFTNAYSNEQVTYARPYLNSSIILFNGLNLQNLLKQNSFLYQAAQQDEEQTKDKISLNVTLAYLAVLTNQDLYKLALAQQSVTQKQLERLDILNRNGSIAPAEYYDIRGQLAGDKVNAVNAANTLENSKVVLAALLNVKYSPDMSLESLNAEEFTTVHTATIADVYDKALNNYAGVKAADLRERSSLFRVKAAKSGFFPNIFFEAGVNSNFSSAARDARNMPVGYFRQFNNNMSQGFSVGLNMPLFNAFRTKYNVAQARLAERENTLVAENTRIQLQQLTSQAYLNMLSAAERYENLSEQSKAFAESFRTMEIRFNAGAINSVDYLVSKNNLDRVNQNLTTNRYDLILRKKILDFYQGKSLE